jgi:hypothetical protein
MSQHIEGFVAEPGVTYRILISYQEELHLALRLRLSSDISLYFFDKQPTKVVRGQSTVASGSTQATVDITKGDTIDDPSVLKGAHLSFHGSGVVKSASIGRATGHVLRDLQEGCQVCSFIFPHPSKLPAVSNLRKSDITISYPVDEGCPVAMNVIAAPRSKVPQISVPGAVFQWSYAFIYESLLGEDDLVIVLHFYHSPGEWPIAKITLFPTDVNQLKPSGS